MLTEIEKDAYRKGQVKSYSSRKKKHRPKVVDTGSTKRKRREENCFQVKKCHGK
jgi:hypothetical protein